MKSRHTAPSLEPPPDDASRLAEFPIQALEPETALFRIARRGRGPWWFSSSLAGRFDLPEPNGTCYLAADPLAALLEVLGPDRRGGAFSARFFAERRLHRLRVPQPLRLSDLTSRRAVAFGVTAEIGTIVPYTLPQAWAAKLYTAGFEGLTYWLRHDPSRRLGFALFGPQGERARWRRGRAQPISKKISSQLREECGLEVLDVPRSDQLRFYEG